MRRASLVTALVTVLSLGITDASAAGPTPVKVLDPPGVQLQPFRNDQWVLFTSNAPATPNHLNAFAQNVTTHARIKLNATGQGAAGGFDPTVANTAIYQQSGPGSSSIFFFNLDTKIRTKVPGVNSPADDTDPRISATYISFFRSFKMGGKSFIGVYLFARSGGPAKRVAAFPATRYLTNGSVGDTYATWTVCSSVTCSAYVYNATAKTLKKIPTVKNHPQYAPVVDEVSGDVYFMRSGFGCGVHVTFYWVPANHVVLDPRQPEGPAVHPGELLGRHQRDLVAAEPPAVDQPALRSRNLRMKEASASTPSIGIAL